MGSLGGHRYENKLFGNLENNYEKNGGTRLAGLFRAKQLINWCLVENAFTLYFTVSIDSTVMLWGKYQK